jgi:hypothetical protein
MIRCLAAAVLLSGCNLPTSGPIVSGVYRLTTTIDEDTCSPRVSAIAPAEVGIVELDGTTTVHVPEIVPSLNVLGWQAFALPDATLSKTTPSMPECRLSLVEQLDVTAHDARSAHMALREDLQPAVPSTACDLPAVASACTIAATLDYELVLPCAPPCLIKGISAPLSCECPDGGAP